MTAAPATVGVVGLGNMGLPMAKHLLAAGFAVRGYDVRPEAAAALTGSGGVIVAGPAGAAATADVVITSLPSVAALREVAVGEDGLVAGARDGLIVIETSTLPVAAKEEAAVVLERAGAVMLDCPLSGTASQMRERDVAVYASGDTAAIERCRDVLAAFSRAQYQVGGFGNGMRMKLIANHLVTVHHTAAAEAMLLAHQAGLDPALALQALSDGAGNSRMLEIRGPMMIAGDFSRANMRLEYFQKDIDLIADLGRTRPVPAAAVHRECPASPRRPRPGAARGGPRVRLRGAAGHARSCSAGARPGGVLTAAAVGTLDPTCNVGHYRSDLLDAGASLPRAPRRPASRRPVGRPAGRRTAR